MRMHILTILCFNGDDVLVRNTLFYSYMTNTNNTCQYSLVFRFKMAIFDSLMFIVMILIVFLKTNNFFSLYFGNNSHLEQTSVQNLLTVNQYFVYYPLILLLSICYFDH